MVVVVVVVAAAAAAEAQAAEAGTTTKASSRPVAGLGMASMFKFKGGAAGLGLSLRGRSTLTSLGGRDCSTARDMMRWGLQQAGSTRLRILDGRADGSARGLCAGWSLCVLCTMYAWSLACLSWEAGAGQGSL